MGFLTLNGERLRVDPYNVRRMILYLIPALRLVYSFRERQYRRCVKISMVVAVRSGMDTWRFYIQTSLQTLFKFLIPNYTFFCIEAITPYYILGNPNFLFDCNLLITSMLLTEGDLIF